MRRRTFIKQSAKVATAMYLAPGLLSACEKEIRPNGKSVIVVGAGIAGIAAAESLRKEGFAVTVLEAQEKVGGRLRSNRSLGIAFDEGASWIHGVNNNPITKLARQAGMDTYQTRDDSIKAYDLGGTAYTDAVFSNTEDALYETLRTLSSQGAANKSFEEVFFQRHPDRAGTRLWRFFLSTYMTFDTGDLDKLSSLLYDAGEEYGGAEKIAVNGYDTIALHLAENLDVQLNERVSRIDYTADKVQVTHNGAVSEADYVLVTVPLGVLKNGAIEFLPALPADKQTAIQKVGMNCVNKFLLTWDATFWEDVQYICYSPEAKDKFNYFVNVNKFHPGSHALMTFAYADYARQTETMTDAQVTEEILAHLRDMYGSSVPAPQNMLRTQWGGNPNAFGAYSYTAVGTEMRHFDDLANAVNNQLFFAGEHTDADYFSTVHGAYLSGIRAAEKITDLL
jgi:monoamine oxidase